MQTTYEDRAAWLAARSNGLGASEVAAALTEDDSGMGLSPYQTRYKLFAEKAGMIEREQLDAERLQWGHRLEPVIAEAFIDHEKGRGWTVENPGDHTVYRSEEHPWLFATPDRILHSNGEEAELALLECKAISAFVEGWDGDEAPLHMRVQVQVQMMCTGIDGGYIAAFDGGSLSLKVWEFGWSNSLAQQIVEQTAAFWLMVEEARELRGHDGDGQRLREIQRSLGVGARDIPVIRRVHPGGSGIVADFDADLDGAEAIDEFLSADARAKAWSYRAHNHKARVLQLAGDADRIDRNGRPAMQRSKSGSWIVKPQVHKSFESDVTREEVSARSWPVTTAGRSSTTPSCRLAWASAPHAAAARCGAFGCRPMTRTSRPSRSSLLGAEGSPLPPPECPSL